MKLLYCIRKQNSLCRCTAARNRGKQQIIYVNTFYVLAHQDIATNELSVKMDLTDHQMEHDDHLLLLHRIHSS